MPAGVYLCGDFTTIVWINILSQVVGRPRYLDISNLDASSQGIDEIVHAIYSKDGSGAFDNCTNNPGVETMNQNSWNYLIARNNELQLNTWYHIAVVMQSTNVYIYINGIQAASGIGNAPNCVARSSNYIGKSNDNSDPYLNPVIDELRIYQGAMNASQVSNDFISTKSFNSSGNDK